MFMNDNNNKSYTHQRHQSALKKPPSFRSGAPVARRCIGDVSLGLLSALLTSEQAHTLFGLTIVESHLQIGTDYTVETDTILTLDHCPYEINFIAALFRGL
jgi:hypothetical protein